jgi:hypothetical protein
VIYSRHTCHRGAPGRIGQDRIRRLGNEQRRLIDAHARPRRQQLAEPFLMRTAPNAWAKPCSNFETIGHCLGVESFCRSHTIGLGRHLERRRWW